MNTVDVVDLSRHIAEINGDQFGEWPEHEWLRDKDGEIDIFGMDADRHNGPACTRCGYGYCMHCQDGPDEPCVIAPRAYAHSLELLVPLVRSWCARHIPEAPGEWAVGESAGFWATVYERGPRRESLPRPTGQTPAEALARAFLAAVERWGS